MIGISDNCLVNSKPLCKGYDIDKCKCGNIDEFSDCPNTKLFHGNFANGFIFRNYFDGWYPYSNDDYLCGVRNAFDFGMDHLATPQFFIYNQQTIAEENEAPYLGQTFFGYGYGYEGSPFNQIKLNTKYELIICYKGNIKITINDISGQRYVTINNSGDFKREVIPYSTGDTRTGLGIFFQISEYFGHAGVIQSIELVEVGYENYSLVKNSDFTATGWWQCPNNYNTVKILDKNYAVIDPGNLIYQTFNYTGNDNYFNLSFRSSNYKDILFTTRPENNNNYNCELQETTYNSSYDWADRKISLPVLVTSENNNYKLIIQNRGDKPLYITDVLLKPLTDYK